MGTNGIWKVWSGIENDQTFGTYEDFRKWADKFPLQKGFTVWKVNDRLPHGPENSYWYHRIKKQEIVTSPICVGCEDKYKICNTIGCFKYRNWFVDNWNKHICTNPPQQEETKKRRVFCYEHPDLVREGLVFRAKEEEWDD